MSTSYAYRGERTTARTYAKWLPEEFIRRRLVLLAVVSLAICIAAWAVDLTGLTYKCPYCRVERTVMGILGLIMLTIPYVHRFVARYLTVVLSAFGFVVAGMQHFTFGWLMMFQGTYKLHAPWYFDSFVLSGAAMFIITAQAGIVFVASNKDRP